MAGTRLWMQATFVVQFFVLAVVALYIGMYKAKDPLTNHLPMYHRGRKLIRRSLQRLEEHDANTSPIRVPTLRLATSVSSSTLNYSESLQEWIDSQNKDNSIISMELFAIQKENDLCEIAANNQHLKNTEDEDDIHIWFCNPQTKQVETSGKGTEEVAVIRNGVTFVYSENPTQFLDDLISTSTLLVQQDKNKRLGRRKPFKMTLMMEHRLDWNIWAEALSTWIQEHSPSLQRWPCLRGRRIQTEVVLSSLTPQQVMINKENSSLRLIPAEQVQESVLKQQQRTSDAWNAILYVPQTTPALFTNEKGLKSSSMYVYNTMVSTISEPERRVVSKSIQNGDNKNVTEVVTVKEEEIVIPVEALVNTAMAPVHDFLLHQCIGAGIDPEQIMEKMGLDSEATAVGNWQLDAALQQSLRSTYQRAQLEIRQEAEWLLQSSTWVILDEAAAQPWEHLVQAVQDAHQMAADEHYLDALAVLEDALDYVHVLRTDPTLMEPLQFSPPQFLAIFSPLLLPLFLPHFIGLIREWKRYKELRDKKAKLS